MCLAAMQIRKGFCYRMFHELAWQVLIFMCFAWPAAVASAQPMQPISLINVMVLYTPQAAASAGGTAAILGQINNAELEANTVFQNSRVNARIYVVKVAVINYVESGSVSNDLARLRNPNDSVFKLAHTWQSQSGADLVCLITKTGIDYEFYGLQGPSPENSYSIIRQPFLTGFNYFPVVLSFNFGCQLERPYADSLAAFPYAYGYSFWDNNDGTEYSTVEAFSGERLPFFSNPDIQFDGQALGIPAGQANPANNALVLNQTAPLVAAFHGTPQQVYPPYIKVLYPATGDIFYSGTNLPLSVTTVATDGSVATVTYYFDGANQIASVGTAPFKAVWPNPAIGTHTLIAVVTDNHHATTVSAPVNLTVLPVNEKFSGRLKIASLPAMIQEPNDLATPELGAPNNNGNPPQHPLWWTWTAPQNTYVAISVASNSVPLNFSVYTGTNLASVSLVASNGIGPASPLLFFFRAMAGKSYQINADAQIPYSGETAFTLAVVAGPANDDFKNRTTLAGSLLTISADNTYATQEPGEPNHAGMAGNASLWWSWTAPTAGQLTLTAARLTGTLLTGVYTGNMIAGLSPVTSGILYYPGTDIEFDVQAGITYQIAFDNDLQSYAPTPGPFAFNLDFISVPRNDNFINRTIISGSWISLTDSSLLATLEPGEPGDGSGNPSIWWSWTAPASGWATVASTTGDNLEIYTGNSLTKLNPVALNNFDTFFASQGTVYAIAAYGPPGEAAWSLILSTVQLTSPVTAANFYLGQSIPLTVSTTANDGNTRQVQYFANGQSVGVSTRGTNYRVNWAPSATGNYQLTATATDSLGHQRSSPAVVITVKYPPPLNDNFAYRTRLSGTWLQITNSNLGATLQPGEPDIAGSYGISYADSIWWTWTATASGTVTLSSTTGDGFGVYTGTVLTNLTEITNGLGPLTFAAKAGTTYDIGAIGPQGAVTLKLSLSNLEIVSPANGSNFTNGSTVILQAVATATEAPVRQVVFFANGDYLGSVTNAPYVLAWTNVYGADYSLEAVAIDKLGHDRSSPAVNIGVHPANDDFVNRTVLQGDWILVTNSTANATIEPGEPPDDYDMEAGSVWWQWTAPASGWVTLAIPGCYGGVGAYTGNFVTNLQTVASAPEGAAFMAVAGTTYDLMVVNWQDPVVFQLIESGLSISSPANGEVVPAGTNLLVSADVGGTTFTVSQVEFFTNNTLWAVMTSPPFTLTLTNLDAGIYTLTAVAVDNQGRNWPAAPVTISAVPPNDNFTNRITLTGTSCSVTSSVANATPEPGEPGLYESGVYEAGIDQTVWYTWTAPVNDVYSVTVNPNWSLGVAVYTGNSLTNLSLVTSEEDWRGGLFSGTAGTTYQIQIDGLFSADFILNLKSRPVNDNFAAAIPIAGTNITLTGDDTLATAESGEPLNFPRSAGNSVWYCWTAPGAGMATVTLAATGSLPSVGIYTGQTVSNLTTMATSASGAISFSAVPGATYWIAVADGPGSFSLNLNLVSAPGNDLFANRTPLTGLGVTVEGTTLYATVEPGEPNITGMVSPVNGVWVNVSPSVWYAWTAPVDGFVRIQTPQTFLGVFSGNVVSNLTTIGVGEFGEEVDFDAVAGQTYPISVVQVPSGQVVFTWSLQMAKVAITNPVDQTILPAGTNMEIDASTIDLEGVVTTVAFYANTNLLGIVTNRPLSMVVSNLTPGDLVLSAQATDQYGGVTTSKNVEIRVPPGNDNFAQRIVFTGTNVTVTGDNSGATTEPGEYLPAGATGRTIWWSWIAPTNGNVTLNAPAFSTSVAAHSVVPKDVITINPGPPPQQPGPTTGPLLAVYTGSQLTNLSLCASNTAYYSGFGGDVSIYPSGPGYPDNWCVISPFTFPVVGGQTYQISLDGVNGSFGAATIGFSFVPAAPPTPAPPAPPNDNFAQRTVLVGKKITTNGSTVSATLELTDPDLGGGLDARTVWYAWIAPASGTTVVGLYPDQFPAPGISQFGVYAGSTPGSLIPVTSGVEYGNSSFYALSGTAYQIEVASPSKSEESFTLTLNYPVPPTMIPAPPVRLANGSYDIHVVGSIGQSFVIQSSTNGLAWTTIDTDTLLAASLDYIDTTTIGRPTRVYRVLPLDTVLNQQPFAMRPPSSGAANGFNLNLTGESGQPFLIQTSTNLVDWFNLSSGVLIDNAFNFTDYDAPNYSRRFYRTVLQ